MELQDVLNNRRSHRVFLSNKVKPEIISQLVEAARLAPISCNLQLTKYIVVDDSAVLKILSDRVSYKFSLSPCTIVVIRDNRFSLGRHSGVFSAAMAVENIILKATELGLATCPMAGFSKDDKIKEILNIPNYYEIDLLLVIGYVDQKINLPDIPKIDVDQLLNFNNFENLKSIEDSDNLYDHTVESIIDYRSRIAPVYLERFRLNTLRDAYYYDVVKFVKNNILSKINGQEILDLMSYDGKFLKIIHDEKIDEQFIFSSSDYLLDNLSYIKDQLDINGYKIDNKNSIDVPEKYFSLITHIFQLDFTPQADNLVLSAGHKLKDGGYFLVVLHQDSLAKLYLRKIQKKYKQIFKKIVYNIYENNPYYKIGPKGYIGDKNIISLFSKNGLSLVEKGLVAKYNLNGSSIKYYLFKK